MAGNKGWFGFSGCGLFWFCLISRNSCLSDMMSRRRSFSASMIVNAQVGVSVVGGAVVERVLGLVGTFDAVVGSPVGVIMFSVSGEVEGSGVNLRSLVFVRPGVSGGGSDCFQSRLTVSCSVFHGTGSTLLQVGSGAWASCNSCMTACFDFFSTLLVHLPGSSASVWLRFSFFLSVDIV